MGIAGCRLLFYGRTPVNTKVWDNRLVSEFSWLWIDKRPKNKVAMQLYERLVKSFMDVIVLKELENRNIIYGYDMIALIYKRFHILVSSGTMYSLLYSMERDGLIEGIIEGRKRVYWLIEKGKERLEDISESSDKIVSLMKSIIGKVAP